MKVINRQQAVSVSICSNIEGFDRPIFIENSNPQLLIKDMFKKIQDMADYGRDHMMEKFEPLFKKIEQIKDEKIKYKYSEMLERYGDEIPVLGFNSGNYDINLNATEFLTELNESDECIKIFSIKNGSSFKVLKGRDLMFLDICQYLPPGYNLDKYIKAFNPKGLKKSIFPYEFLDDYEKLNYDINLLTRNDFFSKLKNKGISDEEWQEFEENKIKYGWTEIRDLLKYYNNLDVQPFLEAATKFFYDLKIDMLKDGFSLPALAEKIMFSFGFKEFNESFIHKTIPTCVFNSINNIKAKLRGYKSQDIDSERYSRENFISKDEVNLLIKKQSSKCNYCWKSCDDTNWTLDRINNDYGHDSNNCCISCIDCNLQRNDQFYSVFYRKKALVRYSYKNPLIYLIDEKNKEVFYKLKNSITGGPSIVFHRYHEANETKIKRPIYENGEWKEGEEGKVVQNITGFDANALYLWCIGNEMPCGRLSYTEYVKEFDSSRTLMDLLKLIFIPLNLNIINLESFH